MAHGGGDTPWLEPGAGDLTKKITAPGRPELDAPAVQAAAYVSIAITFKRLVDMVEPMLALALAQIKKDAGK